jgi:hypothetical protein
MAQGPAHVARLHEVVAVFPAKMIYSRLLNPLFKNFSFAATSSFGSQLWDSKDMVEAEANHKAEGEQMQHAKQAQ